jgi:hypothetical protein
VVSWPAFTTANGLAVAADSTTVAIAPDGFVSVNLAPNLGATPAGLYYTAVYYMSDGTSNTQYWVVPAAAQASLAQVQAQLMPAAQAVQTVSKAYVDQAIAELTGSLLTASGGTLSGPLYLSGDPTQPLQAADKHYVDTTFSKAVPLAGGSMTGALVTPSVNGVQSPVAGSSQTTLQLAMNSAGTSGAMEIPPAYAGSDGFTNPNGLYVADLRARGAQQMERSVKEFGAVCDGATDDTNALQAALNYAQTHGVALTIPQGTCKTRSLNWVGQSIGGLGKQVSALMGFPGQDVLASGTDAVNLLSYTRIHDLTIYVDQSLDVSCSPAEGRAPAGTCQAGRPMERNSIFSPGGSGLTGTAGTGAGWAVGNCAIAMPAASGAGGNGLRVAQIENLEIAATGVDPMAAQYPGAHSTHTCGLYLAQWPQWSEFRNIDIRGLNTGIAIPALPVTAPAGLYSDSNRWENMTIQATHGFTAAAGSNNVLDNVVAAAGNSAATAEPPTGLVLDLSGTQQGWTVRNVVVLPVWNAVQPQLTATASGGAVTAVTVGPEHGLGFDPYGTLVPLTFSGSCTAQATASVNSDGSIGAVAVTAGGTGCSGTTTASVNAAGTWDTAAPVNLIGGQNMTFFDGNLLKGNGGYTVWNAAQSESYGTQLDGGGGTLPGGGSYSALAANSPVGAAYPVDQFPGADFGAKLQACVGTVSASYGGTCDARNFTGILSMGSNLTISKANAVVLLPCATISTASRIIVPAGVRNVVLHGCSLRGISGASGAQGGTVLLYSGAGNAIQVGDSTYALDTSGFRMDNVAINTTGSASAATGFYAYRAQELHLESSYFLGNQNQTGMTIDGTGNYAGGTFTDLEFTGFLEAVNGIGHQIANAAITDWMNASTFVRLHIDCPVSGGNPISGTYGINLQQGDGNTFTGGDVEGCSTALHLGPNAQDNTIVGLRNENSTNQVVADAGSAYNSWIAGGAMYTGHLTDNGTRNSFLDTFHRSFNGLNGDWYGSQQDSTLTNHYRLGIGLGNERGLLNRYQTDYGYRWTMGLSDATAGAQFYEILDELNNVNRLIIGQYLSSTANIVTNVMVNNGGCYISSTPPSIAFSGGGGTGAAATAVMLPATSSSCPGGYAVSSVTVTNPGASYTSQPSVSFSGSNQATAPNAAAEIASVGSTNNQSVLNSAGTGAVVLNGSTNSGTGGVVIGSGGPSETTVATISNAGNAQFIGTLQVGGVSTFNSSTMVKNQADAEIDQFLWAGLTTSQKESLIYKDWNGNSQWYMVKDQNNNWALNSAVGGLDSFKAYQSTNSGDTYIDASNPSGVVRINYESGSGTGFNIYGGGSGTLYASFTGANAIKFPGLAAGSGLDCLQVDDSGYISNTGAACGTGSSSLNGTVSSGTAGQIAYYSAGGTTVSGMNTVAVSEGGTGASTAGGALANLGGEAISLTGSGAPSGACSSSVNNGTFYTSAALSLYQCSGATGVYQWNPVGGGMSWPGGTASGIPDYSYPNAWNGTTPVYNASNQIPASFVNLSAYAPMTVTTLSDLTAAAGGSFGSGAFTSAYSLPIAQPGTLGGVKPDGTSCTVNASTGVLTCPGGAPAVDYNVLNYGAVGDEQPNTGFALFSFTAGSNVVNLTGTIGFSYTFTSAVDVGKYIAFNNNGSAWTTPPWSGGSPYVAKITAVNSGTQIVLSVSAASVNSTTAFGSWGTDNAPAFNTCAATAISKTGGGTCAIPAGRYFFATTPYSVVTGASDDGSYGTPAGGSGGTVTCTPASGSLTSGGCVVSGGTLEKHSATLQTVYASGGCSGVIGWDYGTCGWAVVTVATNSSGVPTTATVVYGGQNITSPVTFNIAPLGGDGAIATATETGGTMNTPSLAAGGDGYTPSSTLNWWALGGGCTAIQNWGGTPIAGYGTVGTNSSGSASGTMSVTAGATGCTSAPTIIFGSAACNAGTIASPAWGQCSNMTPLEPITLPVNVMLTALVNWGGASGAGGPGVGVSLINAWDGISTDNNEPVIFGGTLYAEDIGDMTLSGFMGILATNNANYSKVHDINFSGAFGMWTYATDIGFVADNLVFNGAASWVNGGTWSHRFDYPLGGGGFFDAPQIGNLIVRPGPYGGPGSLAQKLDDWFANDFWHPEFSAASTDIPETCKFPQAANQRQTGHNLYSAQSANDMCYRGVSSMGMAIYTRDARQTGNAMFSNLVVKTGSRCIFCGSLGGMTVTTMSSEAMTPITGTGDPYRNATTLEAPIIFAGDGSSTGAWPYINGLEYNANSNATQAMWDIQNSWSGGTPYGVQWINNMNGSVNTPLPQQNPSYSNLIQFPYGAEISNLYNGNNYPLYFDAQLGAGQYRMAAIMGQYSGLKITDPTLANDWLDVRASDMTAHLPFSAPSLTDTGAAASSGNSCLQINSAGLISNTGSACGSGGGTISSFAAPSGSWPSWLTPTVTNATSAPSLAVAAQSTGAGSVVLANGPTFTGNTTTFANNAAAEQDVAIQPGTGADQIGAFGWNNYAGTSEWKLRKDASNYLRLTDVVNSLDREIFYQNGQTLINSGAGANAVLINSSTNSGTGGFSVESGGASPAAVLSVTGSGNTTATGFVSAKFMMGSGTMSLGTGAAAGTSPSIACASGHVCDGVSGTATLTTGTSTTTGTLATLSFPNTHTNSANCVVDVLQSGVGRVTTATWTESTTAVTLTANTALTASTAYTVKYWCGGN